jgi:hypothetical protein
METGSPDGFSGAVGKANCETIRALERPAADEKLEGRKSRWTGHRRCRGLYGDLVAGCLISDLFSTSVGVEGMHNFSLLARDCANGKGTFYALQKRHAEQPVRELALPLVVWSIPIP